jgi:uncharacterized protein (TIGR03086 family)
MPMIVPDGGQFAHPCPMRLDPQRQEAGAGLAGDGGCRRGWWDDKAGEATMDVPTMFQRAVAEFDARVSQITDEQWAAGTPDEEWTVRDLVNHVVSEDLWAPPLFAGSRVSEVGDRFDGDVLGADPQGSWRAASAAAARAAAEPGVMDRTVHLSFGDFPGREYAMQLFADHLIHAWDLARAIGASEQLDASLVGECTDWFAEVEGAYRSGGAIAERPPIPADAGPQIRLLAMFGRRT